MTDNRVDDLDEWFYTRAKDAVIWWVRATHTHSNVLVNGLCGLSLLGSVAYTAVFRSPPMVIFALLSVVLLYLPRWGVLVKRPLMVAYRVGSIVGSTSVSWLFVPFDLLLRLAPWRDLLWALVQTLICALWYLTAVAPLDPPPPAPRAVTAPA